MTATGDSGRHIAYRIPGKRDAEGCVPYDCIGARRDEQCSGAWANVGDAAFGVPRAALGAVFLNIFHNMAVGA